MAIATREWVKDLMSKVLKKNNERTVVITKNFQQGDLVPYPEGFTMDNCVVLSIMGYYNSIWYNCYNSNNIGYNILQISLRSDGIYCNVEFYNSFTNYKVVLKRID